MADLPNLKVLKLTSKSFLHGDKHKINKVQELPPNELHKILVNGEFQYGICHFYLLPND